MRTRTSLAAFGIALGLALSIVEIIPFFYSGFGGRDILSLLPILSQAAIFLFLVSLARDRDSAGTAKAAAFLMAVLLVLDVFTISADHVAQLERLLRFFGDLLAEFFWLVLLILFTRETLPFRLAETRYAALLLAVTTVLSTVAALYPLVVGSPRYASIFWLFPTGQVWNWVALAVVVAIQAARAVCLVSFFLAIWRPRFSA